MQKNSTQQNDAFKTILTDTEILDLPLFSKTRKEKFLIKTKGSERFH
jgi:hypothetical protein